MSYYIDQKFDLNNALSKLPPEARRVISNIDVASLIWEIGGKFGLLVKEIGDIYEETAKVINGETRPENFIDAIRAKLDDENKNKASDVGIAINTQILAPIREALKQSSTGNLVPNPQEPLRPATVGENQKETSEENFAIPEIPTDTPVDYDVTPQSAFDRDSLMREIENPTPAEISTVSFTPSPSPAQTFQKRGGQEILQEQNLSGQAPQNLPTKPVVDREIPVLRTMRGDMKSQQPHQNFGIQNLGGQATPQRGKFGHATVPLLRQNHTGETQNFKQQIPKNEEKQKIHIGENKQQNTGGQTSFAPRTSGQNGGTIVNKGNQQQTTPKESVIADPTGQANNRQPEMQKARQDLPSEKVFQPIPPVPPAKPTPPPPPQKPTTSQPVPSSPTPIPVSPSATPTSEAPQKTTFRIPQKTNTVENVVNNPEGKNTSYRASIPEQNKVPFKVPAKTNTVSNVVDDKLSKTVNVPSERKRYAVDPYREPLE